MRLTSSMLLMCGAGAGAIAAAAFVACVSSGTLHPAVDAGAGAATCAACVTNGDCNGGVCAQVGGDSYCLAACPTGNECASGETCAPVATISGEQVNVCASSTNICGTGQGIAPVPDAGCAQIIAPTGDGGSCGQCGEDGGESSSGFDGGDAGHHYCQANGCRHGLYCDTATMTCEEQPSACGGSGVPFDAGEGVDGAVTAAGGTVSRLYFAVVGDTRPPNEDETSAYPTQIIDTIFKEVAALRPMPSFAISTGDYQFASPTGSQQQPQVALYVAARSEYPGVLFPAMGNHECTGATASNCGPTVENGDTPNYDVFLSALLAPIEQTSPYYSVNVNASDGTWTAKFVFIAANAWSSAQGTWLTQALGVATTYTFVIRHESADDNTAPGVTPSEAIIAQYPYTLEIVGHTHTYGHIAPQTVLFGNGGAPLSGTGDYGFGIFSQQSDGTILVDAIDYQTGLADGSFRFAVNPDGGAAP